MPASKTSYKSTSWTKIESKPRHEACLATVHYPQPHEDWTQQMWDLHFRGLVIESFYAIMAMHGLKLLELRTQGCQKWDGKPCFVKASKHEYTHDEVVELLNQKGLREKLWSVPEFYENQWNIGWWVQMLNWYYDKFMYICTFSSQPKEGINYLWKNIGTVTKKGKKRDKIWYITSLTKINANFGVTYGQKQAFGNVFMTYIKSPYAKKVIINHAQV